MALSYMDCNTVFKICKDPSHFYKHPHPQVLMRPLRDQAAGPILQQNYRVPSISSPWVISKTERLWVMRITAKGAGLTVIGAWFAARTRTGSFVYYVI